MKRNQIRRLIAILSATMVVGGVAVIACSYIGLHNSIALSGKDLLPTMQQEWSQESLTASEQPVAIHSGTYLGVVAIPSLKIKVNLYEGTESKALAKGAGHYIASVMPGESDNSVIAGHRDTVFSSLGKIHLGALITITTRAGDFTYKVTSTRIVDKSDRTVIVPTESATVTLSTCYPFRFVGSAPQRFIVSAILLAKIV
jgi:sortase A